MTRRLTAGEQKLWRSLTASVHAASPAEEAGSGKTPVLKAARPAVPPVPGEVPPPAALNQAMGGALAVGDLSMLNRATARRLRQGQEPPDGVLDLHGCSVLKAQDRLEAWILERERQGGRRLLVITGKGKPGQPGKIREMLPLWLEQPRLRPKVLSVVEAAPKDGGSGAFYILLKRRRQED